MFRSHALFFLYGEHHRGCGKGGGNKRNNYAGVRIVGIAADLGAFGLLCFRAFAVGGLFGGCALAVGGHFGSCALAIGGHYGGLALACGLYTSPSPRDRG